MTHSFVYCTCILHNILIFWPRGLRLRSAAAPPAYIVGSNPAGGMDVCLL